MVVVAQLGEHRIVAPKVVGSSPIDHPSPPGGILKTVGLAWEIAFRLALGFEDSFWVGV